MDVDALEHGVTTVVPNGRRVGKIEVVVVFVEMST
jgi:hypothetical protein